MKKTICILFCLLLALPLFACASTSAQIAMITGFGDVNDGSSNQSAWEGVRLYAGVHGKTCNYYLPTTQTDGAYLAAIHKAVQRGAEIVILPGPSFQYAAGQAQAKYPNVSFVLLDAAPVGDPAGNTVGVVFAEEEAGYLAGYAAVQDGYLRLGFLGGAPLPATVAYGFGFVQGAANAAKDLGKNVQMYYTYNGQLAENDAAHALATEWYAAGTEVIFACGGAMKRSVFAAAEELGKKTIGVDIDQSHLSNTVITSAVKGLGAATGRTLEQFYTAGFPSGKTQLMGVAEGAVGLAMENSRFKTFTAQDYAALLKRLRAGEVTWQYDKDSAVSSPKAVFGRLPHVTLTVFE